MSDLSETSTRNVAVKYDADGKAEVTLDGKRVEGDLAALSIDMAANQPPLVTFVLSQGGQRPVEFEGLATVQIGEQMDPGPAAAVFLAAMSPEELEKAALNRADLEPNRYGLTKAMLRQLAEWAHGRS